MRRLAQNIRRHRVALGVLVLLALLFASNVPLAPQGVKAATAPRRTFGLFYTYYTDSTHDFGCGTYDSCTHIQRGCHTVYYDVDPITCGE